MNQWVGVLGAEETLELGGVTPEHLRNFFGIEAGEASGQVFAAFGIDPDRIAGGKIAVHLERAGRQQRGTPAANRLAGTRIDHNRAARVGGKTNPQTA